MASDSHCLAARSTAGRLVATATVLVPHPVERQPWIGLFLTAEDAQQGDWATEIAEGLLAWLARDGWREVYVSPMLDLPDQVEFWRSLCFEEVEERLDNNKRRVLVCGHRLVGRAE